MRLIPKNLTMRIPIYALALVTLLVTCATSVPALAQNPPTIKHQGGHKEAASVLKIDIVSPTDLRVGRSNTVRFRLTQTSSDKPITLDDLKEAHTKKLHLLVIDPTLTDYHHVHPLPAGTPGEYSFTFTPRKPGYRLWADVIPLVSGKQEYVMMDIGAPESVREKPHRTLSTVSNAEGYTFKLTLEQPLVKGGASMARIDITDRDGKPLRTLEPVMGAFGHIVGFSEDFHTVAHIHPMGAEPKTAGDRGGPTLALHIEPQAVGFLKLFAQIRIDGKDIFAPFGVMVEARK